MPTGKQLSDQQRETDSFCECEGTTRSAEAHVVGSVSCSVICWFALVQGYWLTFKDMFGEPPPPEADYFFASSLVFGIVAEVIGCRLFVTEKHRAVPTGASAVVGLCMAITALLLLLLGPFHLLCLSVKFLCWITGGSS